MNKIKAFIEKWNHRLQGHLLVTYPNYVGEYESVYALDVYTYTFSVNNYLRVDMCNGMHFYLNITDDITITGA